MKLISFHQGDHTRIGILNDSGVVDVNRAKSELPTDMAALLALGDEAQTVLHTIEDQTADFALEDVHLTSPVPRPGKILAIGLNYLAHA